MGAGIIQLHRSSQCNAAAKCGFFYGICNETVRWGYLWAKQSYFWTSQSAVNAKGGWGKNGRGLQKSYKNDLWFGKQEKDSMPQKANCLKLFNRRFIIDLNTEWKYLCSEKPSDSSMLFA